MTNNWVFFYKYPRITVTVYFTYFKISAFGSYQPLLLLRLNGRVGAIPTYRVYQLYYIYVNCTVHTVICHCFTVLFTYNGIHVLHHIRCWNGNIILSLTIHVQIMLELLCSRLTRRVGCFKCLTCTSYVTLRIYRFLQCRQSSF